MTAAERTGERIANGERHASCSCTSDGVQEGGVTHHDCHRELESERISSQSGRGVKIYSNTTRIRDG
jgi:hypothetical protein